MTTWILLSFAALAASPTLSETAVYVDCVAEPNPEVCEGLAPALAESPGYLWFDDQCDDVAQAWPEAYVAYANEAPNQDITSCQGEPIIYCPHCPPDTRFYPPWGSDAPDDSAGAPEAELTCKSEQEAKDEAVPMSQECDAGTVEDLRCENVSPSPDQSCYECWYRCAKIEDVEGGGTIEGE